MSSASDNQKIFIKNNKDFYYENLHNKFLNFEERPNAIELTIDLAALENIKYSYNDSFIRWAKNHYRQINGLLGKRYVISGYWIYNKKINSNYFLESDIFDKKEEVYLSFLSRYNLLSNYKFIRSVASFASFKINRHDQLMTLLKNYNNQLSIKHEDDNRVIKNYQLYI